MKRIIAAVVGLAIAVALAAPARNTNPFYLYVTGRSYGCGVFSAARAGFRGAALTRREAELRRRASLVDRSESLELWDVAGHRYWVPRGLNLPYLIAEQDLGIYEMAPVTIASGDVVIDAGANVGAFVATALRRGAAKVVAIEPVPRNVDALSKNFADQIASGKVIVVAKGLWDSDGVLPMWTYKNSALDSFVLESRWETKEQPVRVDLPLSRLDDIVRELGLRRVDFVKMDIEGAERRALEGARETIRRFKPRMAIAAENAPDDFEVLPKVVASVEGRYRTHMGPCVMTAEPAIGHEVVFFEPDPAPSSR